MSRYMSEKKDVVPKSEVGLVQRADKVREHAPL